MPTLLATVRMSTRVLSCDLPVVVIRVSVSDGISIILCTAVSSAISLTIFIATIYDSTSPSYQHIFIRTNVLLPGDATFRLPGSDKGLDRSLQLGNYVN